MKYVISESQYKILLREDRVEYLRTQNVITPEILDQAVEGEDERDDERPEGGMNPRRIKVEPIENHEGIDMAYIVTNRKGKQSIKLTNEIFQDIVDADPSNNKQYVQWMIQVFLNHIKEGEIEQAIRFLSEDLPEANEFLSVFDKVKNKKLFKRGAPNRPNAPQNVSDINQYNDLAHLYSVVSPFIGTDNDDEDEEGESLLWKKLKKYIDLGEAKLAYRDNNVLVYTPLSLESSCDPLGPLSSWCTRRAGNSYFDSYRRNNPKPNGELSELYVIIPKEIFDGAQDDFYPLQFHFESNQLHDKSNSSIDRSGKLDGVLSRFPGLKEFFKRELGALLEEDVRNGRGLMESTYTDYLNKFGGKAEDHISGEAYEQGVANIKKLAGKQNVPLQQNRYLMWLMQNVEGTEIVDYLDEETTIKLDFTGMKLKKLPNMSKFKNLQHITAVRCELEELPPIEHLPVDSPLTVIMVNDNNIKEAPLNGYEKLKKLFSITLGGNKLTKINVPVLKSLLSDNISFLRFQLDDDVASGETLSPKNKKEWFDLLNGVGEGLIVDK